MGFFRRRGLSQSERQLLELLLQGSDPSFGVLRRQWEKPFALDIQRSRRDKSYSLQLIFDGNLQREFSINGVSAEIDDLEVVVHQVGETLHVLGSVHKGVLGNVILEASNPVSWPKRLEIERWQFREGSTEKRTLKSFLTRSATPPAPLMPEPFLVQLRAAKRRNVSGIEILDAGDIYPLDIEGAEDHLVFARRVDGSVYTVLREAPDAVYLWELGEGAEKQSRSFTEWLESVSD